MLPPPSSLTPPQTAAELLDRLLRSQLLADSLFGQVFEQSRPYLERRADEYAAALIEKRVLTAWQAHELLAGRVGLYAGTFRLLERLAASSSEVWYAAEQSGPQRLVMLQAIYREVEPSRRTEDGRQPSNVAPFPSNRVLADQKATRAERRPPLVVAPTSLEVGLLRGLPRHPRIGHCVEVQQTPQLQLIAYEFHEAKPLIALRAETSITRPHAAELLRQFISALERLSNPILQSIGPECVWIDPHGQLRLLAGPNPWNSQPPGSEAFPIREALQLAAAGRFAAMVGGLPEVADCSSMRDLATFLELIAKPWKEPYAVKSLPVQRSAVNRLLRRGPTLRRIESLGPEFQVGYTGPLEGETPSNEPPSVNGLPSEHNQVESRVAEAPLLAGGPLPRNPRPITGQHRRVFAFAMACLLLLACSAAAWWFEPWSVRRAGAATEDELPTAKPQTLNPEPSQRDRLPLPQ